MEFVGYDTYDKLVWKSGESRRIKNKIWKQGIPKTHTNKIPHSSKLDFGCYNQKETCNILSEDLILSIFKE